MRAGQFRDGSAAQTLPLIKVQVCLPSSCTRTKRPDGRSLHSSGFWSESVTLRGVVMDVLQFVPSSKAEQEVGARSGASRRFQTHTQ